MQILGGYWEKKSYGDLEDCGWERVPQRRGVFYKMAPHGVAFLMVYVDDFKMVSHRNDTKKLWDPIRKRITMADPAPSDRFLGCYTRRFTVPHLSVSRTYGDTAKPMVST